MTDAELIAVAILQEAQNILLKALETCVVSTIRRAQIRIDMLTIGYEAVQRKIAAGHRYGTIRSHAENKALASDKNRISKLEAQVERLREMFEGKDQESASPFPAADGSSADAQ